MKKEKLISKNKNNLKKTLITTTIISLIAIITATLIQLYGQSKITERCSYLDPLIIDFLAFIAAIFLVIEGFVRIFEYPQESLKNQFTRILRIAFGCSILTLHIIQFLHK